MENIKVTYIPNFNFQGYEWFLKSIADLSIYDIEIINPYILYNTDVDIKIEDKESIIYSYTTYVKPKNLYSSIENVVLSESNDEATIIIYGFDITLDDIKNNIFPLIIDNEDIYISINILKNDKELKSNISVYLDSELIEENEWINRKNEIEKYYEENKNKEENTFSFVLDSNTNLFDIINKFTASNLYNSEEPKENNEINKIENNKIDNDYVCYSYKDISNYISINKTKDLYSIQDEKGNKIDFNKKVLNFIIEILNKFLKS